MSKIRVYELAKMLKVSNKELMDILKDLGVSVKTHMSSLEPETAKLIEDTLHTSEHVMEEATGGIEKAAPITEIRIKSGATVAEVAKVMGKNVSELVKCLMDKGLLLPANSPVPQNAVQILNSTFNVVLVVELEEEKKDKPEEKKITGREEPRPPIVTVMGHVDHGKTTLLDTIRKTKVAEGEAGGITQHIGASVIDHNGSKVVFLDTPGHEAFTSMRARGAQLTDIAILVVAADDGVMPQTIEALDHAKAAQVPVIVAINKIDKTDSKPDRVKQQLSEHELVPEEWGGETIMVNVSAKKNIGIDELLEMVLLVAEMQELKADSSIPARGVVLEAKLDKGKGPVATVIVKEGTLRRGAIVSTDTAWGKVRAMLDHLGNPINSAGPSIPVEILGLSEAPQPGEAFHVVHSEKDARAVVEKNIIANRVEDKTPKKLTLEELYSRLQGDEMKALNVVIKGDVQGSVEALKGALAKLATDEVQLSVIHEGVGRITETDIMLASASSAVVIAFNVRPERKAEKLAESEGVQVRTYQVIYDVVDDIKASLEGLLEPEIRESVTGQAEIRQIFKTPKAGKVAGCHVISGKIQRTSSVRILREGVIINTGVLSALKRFKDDVKEVAMGYDCGMSFQNFQDFKEGDVVEFFVNVKEKRTL